MDTNTNGPNGLLLSLKCPKLKSRTVLTERKCNFRVYPSEQNLSDVTERI